MTRQPPQTPQRPDRIRLVLPALGIVAVVALVWALAGGHHDAPRARTQPRSGAERPVVRFAAAAYPRFGLRLRRPASWGSAIKRGSLDLASPDRTMNVVIATPPGRPGTAALARSDRAELARIFHAHQISRKRSRLGNRPAIVTELLGRTKRHDAVRILSMVTASRFRTYSVQVFTTRTPPRERLVELQGLLASFAYSAPR